MARVRSELLRAMLSKMTGVVGRLWAPAVFSLLPATSIAASSLSAAVDSVQSESISVDNSTARRVCHPSPVGIDASSLTCAEAQAALSAALSHLHAVEQNIGVASQRLNECLETSPNPEVECATWQANFDYWDLMLVLAETDVYFAYYDVANSCNIVALQDDNSVEPLTEKSDSRPTPFWSLRSAKGIVS